MKEVSVAALLRRNPAARRDIKIVKTAQAAIKKRRKAGFKGKGYNLEPAIGGSKQGILVSRSMGRKNLGKLTFGA